MRPGILIGRSNIPTNGLVIVNNVVFLLSVSRQPALDTFMDVVTPHIDVKQIPDIQLLLQSYILHYFVIEIFIVS